MAQSNKTYSVTQEQIDKALQELDSFPMGMTIKNRKQNPEQAREAAETQRAHVWALKETGDDLVGLHLRNNQTFIVQISKKLEVNFTGVLKAGYDQPDKLAAEVTALSEKLGRSTYFSVTLSGKHAPFLISKAPDVNRSILQRSFKIQMKALVGEEIDEVSFLKLANTNPGKENSADYLAAAVTPAILDRTVDILKKAKIRLHAWDCDILCYARAASYLWSESRVGPETRFVIVMGWNRCRLLIMGADGRLVAPVLPMGVMAFLEHLSTTLGEPTVNSQWLDPRRLLITAEDSADVRSKKILANQAIFTLFVPFAQQVKMYLYKSCNDYNVPLPKYFAVMGPGAQLFRLSDSLEVDLGMKALHFSGKLSPEMAGAFGAALWDRHEIHLNLLPANGGEFLERIKDGVSLAREKLGKFMPTGTQEAISAVSLGRFNPVKVLGIAGVLVLALISYPFIQRSQASRELASAKREVENLGPKKEELLRFSERQSQLEKKLILKKMLENQRSKSAFVFREVLYNLPKSVRLTSILYKDTSLNLKGVARTQEDLENLLELYSRLEYVHNPEALSIRRMENKVGFEVRLKLR